MCVVDPVVVRSCVIRLQICTFVCDHLPCFKCDVGVGFLIQVQTYFTFVGGLLVVDRMHRSMPSLLGKELVQVGSDQI